MQCVASGAHPDGTMNFVAWAPGLRLHDGDGVIGVKGRVPGRDYNMDILSGIQRNSNGNRRIFMAASGMQKALAAKDGRRHRSGNSDVLASRWVDVVSIRAVSA